jgi:hypothetical protein
MRFSAASRRRTVSSALCWSDKGSFTMAEISKKEQRRRQKLLREQVKPLSVAMRDQAKNFYMIVGMGITRWSRMEERLIQVAAKLLHIHEDKAGLVMYSIINVHVWLQIIDDLFVFDGTLPKSLKRWRSILSSIRAENDIRVGLAHYSISQEDVDPGEELRAIQAFLRPGKLDIRKKSKTWKPLTMTEIGKFIGRVNDIHDALVSLLALMEAEIIAAKTA